MGAKRVNRYILPTVHRLYSMRFLFIQMYDSSRYTPDCWINQQYKKVVYCLIVVNKNRNSEAR